MLFGALKTNDFSFALPRASCSHVQSTQCVQIISMVTHLIPTVLGTRKHFSRTVSMENGNDYTSLQSCFSYAIRGGMPLVG